MPKKAITREFRKAAKNKNIRVWEIKVEGEWVTINHFWEGSNKVQTTSRAGEAKNINKANEVTREEDALNWAERQIELKTRKGYREVHPVTKKYLSTDNLVTGKIDFSNLARELRFYKPQNNLTAKLKKLLETWKAGAARKRDGVMGTYVIDGKNIHKLYSSSMATTQKDETRLLLDRYPNVEWAMKQLRFLSPNTIFLGEICCVGAGGFSDDQGFDVDNLDLVNGVRGGLTESALELQAHEGYLGFCIWDIAFWGGECLPQVMPTRERFQKIRDVILQEDTGYLTFPEYCEVNSETGVIEVYSPAGDFHIDPSQHPDCSYEKLLLDFAKDQDWEGWVVVDPESTYGEKTYNFRGSPERPVVCGKLKPLLEADFVVRWDPDDTLGGGKIGKRGKGKKSKGVGSVQAYLVHHDGREIPVGLVGGGLEDEDVIRFADPKLYPMVWKVEFASWTKSGSLQFSRFDRERDDKRIDECSVEQNPNWEKHYAD